MEHARLVRERRALLTRVLVGVLGIAAIWIVFVVFLSRHVPAEVPMLASVFIAIASVLAGWEGSRPT